MRKDKAESLPAPGEKDPETFVSCSRMLCYMVPILAILFGRWLLPIVICDDAYISFKVAANTASGLGMVFNPGENTYISTSPLWVLILATVRLLIGDVILAAKILGAACEILLVISIVYFGDRTPLGRKAGMFAALFLITNPVFLLTSFSGMELPLYLLMIVMTSLCVSQKRYTAAMILGALAVWVRFDGIVVFGVSAAIILWNERLKFRRQPFSVFIMAIPGLAIILGYILFGALFFETWLPMSVQRKALTAADFLSAEWLNGAMVILTEFYNAILGKSAHWYSHDTAFPALAILFILGGIVMIVRKNITIVPLLLITIAYVAAFTLSGSSYARHFPWYFAPILPITYLICSAGITSAMSALAKKLPSFPEKRISAVLCALAVIVWLTVSIGPLYSDAVALRYKESERERLYATTAVWAGKHIGNNVVVAADEIGAIGFFLPHEGMMLDMFGLLIRKDKLHVSFVQRIRDEQPHLICTKITYQNKKRIEAKIPGSYTWHRYRRMYVGIRSDLAASLEKFWPDFHRTHGTLYLDREYDWSSVITETSPSQKTMQKNGF